MKLWHAFGVLVVSTVLLGVRTLDVYWTDHGRTDADHFWGAGLAARHGTLKYIQRVGQIRDPSTWAESELFRHDPEAFVAMIRPPGYLVTYDYPPVFALFCMPFTFTDLFGFAALWWLLSVGLYLLCIMEVTRDLRLKLLICAAALHFPPLFNHLRFGSTVIIVMGLALCCGSFGVALAGWFKLYPWALALRRDGRMARIALWSAALGLAGFIATRGDIRPFYEWVENLRQYQHAAGLNHAGTWVRVGVAASLLCVALWRRWHPAVILAIGQGLSPVWWPGYWCAFVPVAAMAVEWVYRLVRGAGPLVPSHASSSSL